MQPQPLHPPPPRAHGPPPQKKFPWGCVIAGIVCLVAGVAGLVVIVMAGGIAVFAALWKPSPPAATAAPPAAGSTLTPAPAGAIVLSEHGAPRFIAVDDERVYWSDTKEKVLLSQSKKGGAIMRLSSAEGKYEPMQLTLDADRVYWFERRFNRMGRLRSVPKGGGAITELREVGEVWDLVVDPAAGGRLYWSWGLAEDIDDDGVRQVELPSIPKTGGELEGYLGDRGLFGPALDATHFYYVAWEDDGVSRPFGRAWVYALYRVPRSGGKSELVATGDCEHVALQGAFAYCADRHELWRVAKAGGSKQVLWKGSREAGDYVRDLAVDADHAYFTTSPSSSRRGRVLRVPTAGGAVEVVAEGQPQPVGIALDGAYVYWANSGYYGTGVGGVVKLKKNAPR